MRKFLFGAMALSMACTMPGVSVLACNSQDLQYALDAGVELSEEQQAYIEQIQNESDENDADNSIVCGNFRYIINSDNTATITGHVDTAFPGDLVIPSHLDGYPVAVIGTSSFAFTVMSSITFPSTVKKIESSAFLCMEELERVVLPEGLETIESRAITTFYDIKNPIYIPSTVKSIGGAISTMATYELAPNNPYYKIENDALYTMYGDTLVCGWSKSDIFSIPDGVTEILPSAFEDNENIKKVYIPSSVESIGASAFTATKISKVIYNGNEAGWNAIAIDKRNYDLEDAKICFIDSLKDFVERMYTVALGREADATGLNTWVQMLSVDSHDGAAIAKEFVLGEEFAMRNLDDEKFVEVMYRTFFGREADDAGKQLWMAELAAGKTREYVCSKFVNLEEFTLLCANYGISRGVMYENGSTATPGCVQFVERLYDIVMDRNADNDGLYMWTLALTTGTENAETIATNFFSGNEYVLRETSTTFYVKDLYRVFFDREPDSEGKKTWVNAIDEQGVSRSEVLSSFAKSEEFKMIAAKYGIQ